MSERTIKSALPGTFFRASGPDAEPYVSEGDRVQEGDVIGLVEIMKTFHEIKADEAGTIERFLVGNKDPVDAGQDVVALSD